MKDTKKKVLVVHFEDNDFRGSLLALGNYLLETVGYEAVYKLYKSKRLNSILTYMFKHHLSLYQHRFDMIDDNNSIDEIIKDMQLYMNRTYFTITDTELKVSYEDEYDNGETLVVDFYNNQTLTI